MFATKSWETSLSIHLEEQAAARLPERRLEFIWLLAASFAVACGLALVFIAKTRDFAGSSNRLTAGGLVNLNAITSAAELSPMLESVTASDQRDAAANSLANFLVAHRPLPNVGAIARLHLAIPVAKIKPLVVVRTPAQWIRTWALWIAGYFFAFWFVHFSWRALKFRGDPVILPALHLLTGIGLILMTSLRDPLRDTLEFKKFTFGVLLGCAILLLPLLRAFQYRHLSNWVYTPLLISFVLFAALLRFGSGPTGSDAKVNLGPFQPVEIIKVLVVLFIAGYFTRNWERLRDLHQKTFVPRFLRWLEIPRISHALPVMIAVGCALALLFVLKDMGPALVLGFVFLTGFAIARKRAGLAILGIAILIVGVTLGYRLGVPHTVVERVSMWLSPWNNDIRGGDQLAHSLWGFATGGPWGSGPGWGDPSVIPAGHTDLVLPSIAEEWGYCGILSIALLLGLLVARGFRIALRAPDEYGLFLCTGLSTLIPLEMLLISGGALGAIPLSGVVSPFISSGNTAMLANFAIMAILLGVSNQSVKAETTEPTGNFTLLFGTPVRAVGIAFALCAVTLLVRAASVCIFHADDLLARDAHVFTHDGVKRAEHNPRLNLLAASIPRGNIYDRNGVLLATSSWQELERRRSDYAQLGINIDQVCSKFETRHYPFGPVLVHFLGDLRTGEKFHATNASLVEHDANIKLQGYRDYGELATVVRYRHRLQNPQLQALLSRDRDIHTTVDIRLQSKAVSLLEQHLAASGKKGAIVVLNAGTGELLAEASWPIPPASGQGSTDELLDRARYGEYPPGSTFKLVTAMAALRLDSRAYSHTYTCRGLGDGRVGTIIPGWRRPIRDDIKDHAHGTLNMANAIAVSCNAYFAQLGVYAVGSKALQETANLLGISVGTDAQVRHMLPFASYGQGDVITTPFKMARVAATIADGGTMPQGRWILEPDSRSGSPVPVLAGDSAEFLQKAMRAVVTGGTARSAMAGLDVNLAGKTGTAQLDSGEPHSWFAGYAPYDAPVDHRIAFAVLVEHGGYGALTAAPIARELLESAKLLGLVSSSQQQVNSEVN